MLHTRFGEIGPTPYTCTRHESFLQKQTKGKNSCLLQHALIGGKLILFIFPYKNLHFESFVISPINVFSTVFKNSIVPSMNALYLLYNSVAKQYLRYGECQSIN